LIVVGGLGTIAAVSLVGCFLVWVVVPLFLPARAAAPSRAAAPWGGAAPRLWGASESGDARWALLPDGRCLLYREGSPRALLERRPFEPGPLPTALALASNQSDVAFGFADGSARLGRIVARSEVLGAADVPEAARAAAAGAVVEVEGVAYERRADSRYDVYRLEIPLEEPVALAAGSGIERIDFVERAAGPALCAIAGDGRLLVRLGERRENLLTGETTVRFRGKELALPSSSSRPRYLLLSRQADCAYVAWEDGRLLRYALDENAQPTLVEELDLVEDGRLVALHYLPGRGTLVAGDSRGGLSCWFRIRPERPLAADGWQLVRAHQLPSRPAAVTALATSDRNRLLAAGYADGAVALFYPTTEHRLLRLAVEPASAVDALLMNVKGTDLAASSGGRLTAWRLDVRYPEASLRGLLLPIWYEGYPGPAVVWQSTGGSDDPEPKLSLTPLIFGTLKATLYSMLFGAPIALLAAIYTSEYLPARSRARLKPTIELMASLPSVVLGFVAALVLAPFVEEVLPAVLAGVVLVPAAFLLFGHLWQLAPASRGAAFSQLRFWFVLASLPLALWGAVAAGTWLERGLFAGDVLAWLDRRRGAAWGGWAYLLFPLCALAVMYGCGCWVNPALRRASRNWTRTRAAWVELAKFLLAFGAALALAAACGGLLQALRFDPRGSIVDTFDQRNALVVGFVMGFAIIPIIYTIADDALFTVPDFLRSASLGAGATPWQTATHVVVPTAMSGLFSAVMVGLGRAVGETMIVLMAAGNTPIMEWNIFNGFRTLSANIAVELPEAVQGGTHYRVLFLAALALFTLTFFLNSLAEVLRQRFRRRAYQL
jgi:phosphate transport system permease protein